MSFQREIWWDIGRKWWEIGGALDAATLIGYPRVGWPRGLAPRGRAGLGYPQGNRWNRASSAYVSNKA